MAISLGLHKLLPLKTITTVKRLSLQNFTLFEDATFDFCPGINVIIGENGTGKSQLMKAAYSAARVSNDMSKNLRYTREEWERNLTDKLCRTCRPDTLGRLVSRMQGRKRCEIGIEFSKKSCDLSLSFATNSKEVKLEGDIPKTALGASPVFIPTREILSIYPGFAATYREREIPYEETYYDLALLLEAVAIKSHKEGMQKLIDQIGVLLKGRIRQENGRFYLYPDEANKGQIEIALVAEGERKLAMLAYLLINGSLREVSTLFWDEPETNLNPKLIKGIASALYALANSGCQVVISTHSLFLLRELEILSAAKGNHKVKRRYFNLQGQEDKIVVQAGDTDNDIGDITSLDESLMQSDRYMALD